MEFAFRVEYLCHRCGESHRVVDEVDLAGSRPATIAEGGSLDQLFPNGDVPDGLERLLGEMVWCEGAGDWIELEDPARVFVVASASTA